MEVIRRAIQDTRQSFGFSFPTAIRSVAVPLAVVILLFYVRGVNTAMNAATELILYVTAFACVALLPTFLWNLWLAPYRIIKDQTDAIEKQTGHPTPEVASPQDFDVAHYKDYRNLMMWEAACLWVGVDPHHPVTHFMAKIKLGQLKSAIRGGELRCQWRNGLTNFLETLNGGASDRNPSDKQQVSLIALRRYADLIGDVPEFLRHVQVPVELPPADKNDSDGDKGATPPTPETPMT